MSRSYSFVSVIVPAYNEERHIQECLESLVNNGFPQEKLEIMVMDGGSDDNTVSIVTELATRHSIIKLLPNPDRIVSNAMNLGADNARGEILIRADAHAIYAIGYIEGLVNRLVETGAAGVGGVTTAVGIGLVGNAIAITLSLPLGSGGAAWRGANSGGWVDTMWCGCFWKEDFLRIGGFDPRWVRNQDAEFNYRLRNQVGGLYVDPGIRVTHFVRESFRGLGQQFFKYGWWRARTAIAHPETLKLRQVVPVIFVCALVTCIALVGLSYVPLAALIVAYGLILIYSMLTLSNPGKEMLLVPVAALVIHLSWGAGFILSLIAALFDPTKRKQETQ